MARELDHWLQSYLEYTKNLEAPDAFHFWSGVSTLAAALGGKVWIDMEHFKWKPNFFIIFVAPPGTATKSTTIRVGSNLLRHVEGIHFGPKSLTWQYITDALANSQEVYEDSDGEPITTASLHCEATELGTFLDPKNSYMIDMLVDLWDGQDAAWTRGTRGEGEAVVENPWVNFIGATTPSWIADSFPEYAIGGGFVSRTVFVYAEHKRHLVAYPKYQQSPIDKELEASLIADLQRISRMTGEFTLSEEARAWGEDWYHELWRNRPSHLNNERMSGYVARKQSHIHKLAMVLSAAQRETQEIYRQDLEQANEFMRAIEKTMDQVFSQVTDNTWARYASHVVRVMRRFGKAGETELWQEVFHMMAWSDFQQAVTAAVNAGYVAKKQQGNRFVYEYIDQTKDEEADAGHHA